MSVGEAAECDVTGSGGFKDSGGLSLGLRSVLWVLAFLLALRRVSVP